MSGSHVDSCARFRRVVAHQLEALERELEALAEALPAGSPGGHHLVSAQALLTTALALEEIHRPRPAAGASPVTRGRS